MEYMYIQDLQSYRGYTKRNLLLKMSSYPCPHGESYKEIVGVVDEERGVEGKQNYVSSS